MCLWAGIVNFNRKPYRVGIYVLPLFFCKEKQRKSNLSVQLTLLMVPLVGFEPTRYRYHWILSPARLPVSPQWHYKSFTCKNTVFLVKLVGTIYLPSFFKIYL